MSTLVLVEGKIKADEADALEALLKKRMPDTRAYEGNERLAVNFDEGREAVVLVENWASRARYEKYLN